MSFAARGEARDMEFATTWKQRYIQPPSCRSDAPVSAFLPFSLAVGHGRFPALADGTFHVLGLLEDSNQRNKLFFRERVVINSKCCKVRADFLFLGAALKMYGLHQLLLHSGSGQVIVCGQSIRPVFLPDVPQEAAQIVRNEMPEIFFLLYLRRFQSMEVQIVSFLAMLHQNHLAGSFQNRIHILDPHICDSVNVNFRIQHKPLEILMADQLRQQPVVELACS